MADPAAILIVALAAVATVASIAFGVADSRRGRKGGRPGAVSTAESRRRVVRALDRGGAGAGVLLVSLAAKRERATNGDGTLAAGGEAHSSAVRPHAHEVVDLLAGGFGSEAVHRIAGRDVAVLVADGGEEAVRRAVETAREAVAGSDLAGAVTIGAAFRRTSDDDGEGLVERAAAAAVQARQEGGDAVVSGDGGLAAAAATLRPRDLGAIRDLLAAPQLRVRYQPIVSLDDGSVIGFEALSRPAERFGFEGTDQAFAAAMRVGRAAELDALCRAVILDDDPGADMPDETLLFCNLTPAGLTHPSLAPPELLPAVRLAGLTPDRVVFELTTPSTLDAQATFDGARQLAGLGFRLALDDVGAGRGAADLLGLVPATFLKLDPSLLEAGADDDEARRLLAEIRAVAKDTGATLIAKGVERDDLLRLAHESRLDADASASAGPRITAAQGHLLAPPRQRPQLPERPVRVSPDD